MRGYTGISGKGNYFTGWHPDYAGFTTVLHEADHVHTNDALYAYENRTATPRQEAYGKKIQEVFDVAKKEVSEGGVIPEEWKAKFQNLREFNAYGLSDHKMRALLQDIPYRGSNAFSRMVQAVKEFFGAPSESVFTKLVKESDSWGDELKTSDRMKAYNDIMEVDPPDKTKLNFEKIPADYNYHETAEEAVRAARGKDLHGSVPQNFITPNQVYALSKHPVVGFFMDKMGTITRQTSNRFHWYARKLEPFLFNKETRLNRDSLVRTYKTLVDIQDPKLKLARTHAEATGTREEFLAKQGLSPREVTFAVRVLDIMYDVHKADIKSVGRLGRNLDYQPMYFPRVHGGRFVLKVLDAEGREQYVKGFDSWKEARETQAQLTNHLKDTDYKVQDVTQAAKNTFGDDFSMLLLEHSVDMGFLEKGLKTIEKKRETAPFAFEKARRESNVGGYVGEDIASKAEQESLLKVMSWRLQASRNIELKSRMLTEIKYPLFDTGALGEMPRVRQMVGNLINRELGVNISGVPGLDSLLNRATQNAAKALKAISHFEEKYVKGKDIGDFRWDDPMVRADLAEHLARQITYTTSQFKLALNIPVYITNFASNAIIGLHGIRQAHIEGLNSGHAMSALFRTWSYFGQEAGVRDFMLQAREDGMIETKGQEHYTTAEIPDRNSFDRAIQYPRDKIEEMTNYHATMYYYHFWKAAAPELTGEAFKAKVYQGVKSFTGQYESYAGPLMFDKAGTMGQMMTNFAKWHFNQLGMLLTDIKMMGKERDAVPLLMTIAMTTAGAGLYGLPGVVEYDSLRRLGQSLGAWDLPPVSGLRSKIPDKAMPYWEFMERGPITAASDALAKQLGAPSGPDVSGSMRYSSFLDFPTVAFQTLWSAIGQALPTGLKELRQVVGGPGANAKELENAFKVFPSALTGLVKRGYDRWGRGGGEGFFKQKVVAEDGTVMWHVMDPQHQGKPLLYTQSDIEDTYNLLGMRSKREQKNLEGIHYDKWQQRQDLKDIKDYTDGIVAHIGDNAVFKNNIGKIAELGGPEAVKSTLQGLQKHYTAEQFDYLTQLAKAEENNMSIMQRKKQLQRLKDAQKMVKGSDSPPE